MNAFARPGLAEEKLPPVSSADNGKVLGVNNGVWEKVAASGGSDLPEVTADDKNKYLHTNSSTGDLEWSAVSGGALVVHVTATTIEESTIYTCDKTAAEMYEAMQTGVVVIAPYTEDSSIYGGVCALTIEGQNFVFIIAGANKTFTADSASGYPSYSKGGK